MSGYGRIYATIDLDAVSYNLDSIQKKISSGTDIIAVVKADGYGHGALEISRMLERETRVFGFAVASAEEAFALRDFGIQKPVLILGYTFAEDYEALKDCTDVRIQKILTQEVIEEAKKQAGTDWGEFQQFGKCYMSEQKLQGKTRAVVQINAAYENIGITYTLFFNEDMKLSGLYIK